MMLKAGRLLVTQAALCVLVAGSVQAGQPSDLERFNGRWKLDWERSEPMEPMMKVLELPWLLRKLAGIVSVYVSYAVEAPECEGCEPRLRIVLENPIKNTTRVVVLDGEPRPATDPLGNTSLDRFSWNPEHGMKMVRERSLKSGRSARLVDRRRVEDDLKTMVATLKVWVDDEERVSVRRVFIRVEE